MGLFFFSFSFLFVSLGVGGELFVLPGGKQSALCWIQAINGTCGAAVTNARVSLFHGNITFFGPPTLVQNLIASPGRVAGAAAPFRPRNGGSRLYLAIADNQGGISFSVLNNCSDGIWQLVPEWSIQVQNTTDFVAAAIVDAHTVRFVSSTQFVTVGWVQGLGIRFFFVQF